MTIIMQTKAAVAVDIKLSSTEMFLAAQVGVMRQIQNLNKGRKGAYGSGSNNDWQLHIEGAMGECAVAKAMGIYWNGAIGDLDAGDVGRLQVRTRSSHRYELILHKRDSDDDKYILVTGKNGQYRLHGWIKGNEGKNPDYWSDPAGGRPAFFVPQGELNDIVELHFQ